MVTEIETVGLASALNRVLATDVVSPMDVPAQANSAMDGYAIGGEHQGPWKLVGESRAGTPFDRKLAQGETVRISTGAHVPSGADRILIQENAQVDGEAVTCFQDFPNAMRHIRQRGFDFSG